MREVSFLFEAVEERGRCGGHFHKQFFLFSEKNTKIVQKPRGNFFERFLLSQNIVYIFSYLDFKSRTRKQ